VLKVISVTSDPREDHHEREAVGSLRLQHTT
jgi:hypothetical protein